MNVYDFDKTIYRLDSTMDFYYYCLKKHPLLIVILPRQVLAFFFYIFRLCSKEKFKSVFLSFIKNLDINQLVEEYWNAHFNGIQKWYLRQKKADDVIVSASPRFIIEPICRRLGVTFICTETDSSGTLISPNCYGKEKVIRFLKKFPNDRIDSFYSDSASDEPMARIAKKAYLVKNGEPVFWKV